MENCPNCGCAEFVTEPNQYDVLTFEDGDFSIVRSESIDGAKIFCRDCGKEVISRGGNILPV